MSVAQRNADWSSLARRTQYPAYLRPSILVLFVLLTAGLVVLWWFNPGKAQPVRVAPRLFGPNWDMSKFGRSITLEDGNTGVFTYSRSIYRQQGQGGLIFGGSTSYYITDVKFIGTYDFRTQEAKIVYRKQHEQGGDGGGNLVPTSTAGQLVLVFEEPTRQADFVSGGRWLLFSLQDSSLTELPLMKELAEQQLDMQHCFLMKRDGTLMIVAKPLNPDGSRPFGLYGPYEIFVRLPAGEYLHAATADDYGGFLNDEVSYSVKDELVGSVHMAYSIVTQSSRKLPHPEGNEFRLSKEHPVNLWVTPNGKELQLCRRDDGKSSCTPLTISERLLH